LTLSKKPAGTCYATVGVHPCSSQQFDKHPKGHQAALASLKDLAIKARDNGTAVAFGEIGLDYDRLFLAPKDTQLKYFEAQLDLATELHMPLFLHSRACSEDFERLLKSRLDRLPKRGLVHSFTGTVEEMQRLVDMGFDIGINGCSMKTEENVSVVKEVPLERLQIETDGPWVRIFPSAKAGYYTSNIYSVR
jgi:TatD DNase family protein